MLCSACHIERVVGSDLDDAAQQRTGRTSACVTGAGPVTVAVAERPPSRHRRLLAGSRQLQEALREVKREFPAWVVWRDAREEWSATRPPKGRSEQPSPGSHLIWAYAHSAEDLKGRMRERDG